jgi:hypothetical protein
LPYLFQLKKWQVLRGVGQRADGAGVRVDAVGRGLIDLAEIVVVRFGLGSQLVRARGRENKGTQIFSMGKEPRPEPRPLFSVRR